MNCIANHKTDGEIGSVFNHHVTEAIGHVPNSLYNHEMMDAAPTTKCIVNHDLNDCTDEEELARVLGVYRYPGRVLATTNPGDIIQLHPELKFGWNWIVQHYRNCGIKHSLNVFWDDDMNVMSQYPELEPNVFFFGDRAHRARPNYSWHSIARYMNDKNNFIKSASMMNVPVPETHCFMNKMGFGGDYKDINFPVYLKVSKSVSGMGVVLCRDVAELEFQLSQLDEKISFQLQEDLGDAVFINLQYRVENGVLQRVVATDQILKGCQHNGNRYPSKYDVWSVTDPLALMMFERGMKGYFAFDVAISGFNGSTRALLIECNPRYNGSTYPTNIALKLGISQWSAKNIATGNVRALDDIDLGEVEYSPKTGKGVVVFNWGCVVDGKIGVLFAGTPKEQLQQEEYLNNLF